MHNTKPQKMLVRNKRTSHSSVHNKPARRISSLSSKHTKRSQYTHKISKKSFSTEPNDGLQKDPSLHVSKHGLTTELVDSLTNDFGITHLFPIQAKVMDPIQAGKDVFGKSKTGTGKTLAFLLPMIDEIVKNNFSRPQQKTAPILILEPTRELASQVTRELEKLCPQIRAVTVYGGTSYDPQRNALRNGVHVCVATPGRLIDLVESGAVDLSATHRVVLDEADEMLKFGFQQAIEQILQRCSVDRQTILFSATLSKTISNIVRNYTNDVQFIDCTTEGSATPSLIKHKACMLPRAPEHVPTFVFSLFRMYSENGRAIVFTDTKATASELETLLNNEAKNNRFAAALHGDIGQNQRENILQRFRKGELSMLLATDVAARGIDIPSVDLVVQLGIPREIESYVHRSGRTGRAGKPGTCVLCYRHFERDQMGNLSSQTGVRFSQVVREDLKTADSIDESVVESIQRGLISGYTMQQRRYTDTKQQLAENNEENVNDANIDDADDESSSKQVRDPLYAAAVRVADELVEKYDPKVLLTAQVFKELKQRIHGGDQGASFSLLASTPHHTTIALPSDTNISRMIRRLSTTLGVDANVIRPTNQLFTSQAILVDVPDEIFSMIEPLVEDNTIDYIQIPRKLPGEVFVGGIVGQQNRRGGNGGNGGNNRGGNFRGGNSNFGRNNNNGGNFNRDRNDRNGNFGGDRRGNSGRNGNFGGDRRW